MNFMLEKVKTIELMQSRIYARRARSASLFIVMFIPALIVGRRTQQQWENFLEKISYQGRKQRKEKVHEQGVLEIK